MVDETKHDSRFAFYALSLQGGNAKALAGGAATPIINKSAFSDIEIGKMRSRAGHRSRDPVEFPHMNPPPKTFSESNLFEIGIGHVIIARYKSDGRVEAGVFLLDVYCLGVKDAFFRQFSAAEFSEFLDGIFNGSYGGPPVEHSGAWGRKLVEDAVEYARRLGFAPHPDYKQGAKVLGGINPKECSETFVFGSEGKPLYIAGPYDGEAKRNAIMRTLTKKLGPQGFHFILPHDPDAEEDFDDSEEE